MRSYLGSLGALAVLVAVVAFVLPARAEKLVIKLGTMAPEGTSWYNGLRDMGDRWAEISGGRVEVKIYAGGVAGNEGNMLRKIRIGQLHGAALSNLGLQDIDDSAQVTNTPMLIENYDELDYVMEHMSSDFEAGLKANGFTVLTWGDAGWVYFFSKTPIASPADASKIKVFCWEGDPAAAAGFREVGFNPVAIPSVDMIPSLQSGLIDGFPNTPLYALSAQWFALAPNMLDVPWAPLVGATVISNDIWDQIPAQYHEEFMAAAREIGTGLRDEIRRQDAKAITVMKKYGLNVVEPDAATRRQWKTAAERTYPIMRGKVVPEDVFDRCKSLVEEYRASH